MASSAQSSGVICSNVAHVERVHGATAGWLRASNQIGFVAAAAGAAAAFVSVAAECIAAAVCARRSRCVGVVLLGLSARTPLPLPQPRCGRCVAVCAALSPSAHRRAAEDRVEGRSGEAGAAH